MLIHSISHYLTPLASRTNPRCNWKSTGGNVFDPGGSLDAHKQATGGSFETAPLVVLVALLLLAATMLLLRKARHQVVVLVVCILILHVVGLDARRRTKPELRDKGPCDWKLRLELPCAFALCGGPESRESEIKSIEFILTYLR